MASPSDTQKHFPFWVSLFDNMGHQPHISLHQNISGLQVPPGAPGEIDLLFLLAQRLWKGTHVSGQVQG